jgi:hypothetical protein
MLCMGGTGHGQAQGCAREQHRSFGHPLPLSRQGELALTTP